jgi:WD40 repeat protein/cellulose biosynthesis protein BcsQ
MIYTFYSYKGGVGRSMALANVAELLCQEGLNVLMVDWDLEAPGLEKYFAPMVDTVLQHFGLMDMLQDYKQRISRPPADEAGEEALPFPKLEQYIIEISRGDKGCLRLMPAGKRVGEYFARYANLVRVFDWKDFYQHWEGELFFEWMRKAMSELADVVLIDSRTGVTEMGGVCAYQLADTIVMFCAPNQQNLDGTFEMAANFTDEDVKAVRQDRPLNVLIIPARVEDRAETGLLNEFKQDFLKKFSSFVPENKNDRELFWRLKVPHVPYYAFKEVVAMREAGEARSEDMANAFIKIAREMAARAPQNNKIHRILSREGKIEPGPVIVSEAVSPYRGLSPFYEEHSQLFFGRQRFVERLLDCLRTRRLVSVIGLSGSGKSSVVRAGLVPALRTGALLGSKDWPIIIFTPGDHPFKALAASMSPILQQSSAELDRSPSSLAEELANRPGSLSEIVARSLKGRPTPSRLMMVIDQFEELYTLCRDTRLRHAFLNELLHGIANSSLSVVLTLRADFYSQLIEYRPFSEGIEKDLVNLGPMTRDELSRAVVMPAQAMGVEFEPGLVERILSDVGEELGNLPLLEFALTELWNYRTGGKLSHNAYESIGGVQGAIARCANDTYLKLSPEDRKTARRIFLDLVRPGEGMNDTRRRAIVGSLAVSAEKVKSVVKVLADARLVVTGRDETTGEEFVELAHEALIRNWGQLRAWLDEVRDFLVWRQRLQTAIDVWKRSEHDEGALLRGVPLTVAQSWQNEQGDDLTQAERDYISESLRVDHAQRKELEDAHAEAQAQKLQAEVERQKAEEQRLFAEEQRLRAAAERVRARLWQAFALVFLLAIAASVIAWIYRGKAVEQSRVALSQQLAAQVQPHLDDQLDLALLLASQAIQLDDNLDTENGLLAALQRSSKFVVFLRGHSASVSSIAFSPLPGVFASGDTNGRIILWDLDGSPSEIAGSEKRISSLCFSPNGKTLASASDDGKITLWNLDNHAMLGEPFPGSAIGTNGLLFTADEKLIFRLERGKAVLWDISTRRQIGDSFDSFSAHDVTSVALSHNGKILALGNDNGSPVFWDIALRKHSPILVDQEQSSIETMSFNPADETLTAIRSEEYPGAAISMWDVKTGKPMPIPLTPLDPGPPNGGIISPDGRAYVYSSDGNKKIVFRDLHDNSQQGVLMSGNTSGVASMGFSPDRKMFAAGNLDGTIQLFDLERPNQLSQSLRAPNLKTVFSAAITPDGKTVAAATTDGVVILWDLERPETPKELKQHEGDVYSVGFSLDGKFLASAGEDGSIILFDIPSGMNRTLRPRDKTTPIRIVAFRPDSKMLVSASFPSTAHVSTIHLWDLTSSEPTGKPVGEFKRLMNSIAFSPNGKLMAMCGIEGKVYLGEVSEDVVGSGKFEQINDTDPKSDKIIECVAFSTDGAILAWDEVDRGYGSIMLWDLSKRTLKKPLKHANKVNSLSFSKHADKTWLASGNEDQTITIWDVEKRQQIGAPLRGHTDGVISLAFNANGKRLISGSSSYTSPALLRSERTPSDKDRGEILVWETSVKSWQERACAIANRDLSAEEIKLYMGDERYHPCSKPSRIFSVAAGGSPAKP